MIEGPAQPLDAAVAGTCPHILRFIKNRNRIKYCVKKGTTQKKKLGFKEGSPKLIDGNPSLSETSKRNNIMT